MSTKQAANRANKAAKRNSRAKVKKQQASVAKHKSLEGTRPTVNDSVNARWKELKKKVRQGKMTQAKMNELINNEDQISRKQVVETIIDGRQSIIRLHAGVEVYEILAKEGRFVITPEEQKVFDAVDGTIFKIAEDMDAIFTFIEAGAEPSDFVDLYLHMIESMATFYNGELNTVYKIIEQHKDELDTYSDEHRDHERDHFGNEAIGESVYFFSERMHDNRMVRIEPLYKTVLPEGSPLHSYTPADPQPLDPVESTVTE